MCRRVLLLLILTIACTGVQAASVWKVSDGINEMFLGGTMHILSPSDYPLPTAYQYAYERADTLVFETDIGALSSPQFAQKSLSALTYGGSKTLADEVSQKTLEMLKSHLQTRGLTIERFLNMRPALVGISLTMIEFERLGLTSQGVDQFYYTKAMSNNKPMFWLESPEQQLAFISDLGVGKEDEYLQYSIEDIEALPKLIPQLRALWKAGDTDGLYSLAMADFKHEYPSVYDAILTQRNQNWLPQLVTMMASAETEFVLVGALHIPGETGMLALLKSQGYSIEKL